MKSRLAFVAWVYLILAGCSGNGGAPPPMCACPVQGIPFSTTGQLAFPNNGGFSATASYTLASSPGGSALLDTQVGGANVPVPFSASGPVIAAFIIQVLGDVQLTRLPSWQITVPLTMTLSGSYALEYCSISQCEASTTLSVSGHTLSAAAFGPPVAFVDADYVFELVPFTPPPPP